MLLAFVTSDISNLFAEIYQWTDSDGSAHFSDTPPINNTENKSKIVHRNEADLMPSVTPRQPLSGIDVMRRNSELLGIDSSCYDEIGRAVHNCFPTTHRVKYEDIKK
jgi:hypothetical protein